MWHESGVPKDLGPKFNVNRLVVVTPAPLLFSVHKLNLFLRFMMKICLLDVQE